MVLEKHASQTLEWYKHLQTHERDVRSMAQGPELVNVDQSFRRLLLVVDREVAERLCSLHVLRLIRQLRQQDLQPTKQPLSHAMAT